MVEHGIGIAMPRPPPLPPAIDAGDRRRRASSRRRALSPPALPPCWGQAVAPPPTPFNVSPSRPVGDAGGDTAPFPAERSRSSMSHHRHHRKRRHKCSHPHHQSGDDLRHQRHSLGRSGRSRRTSLSDVRRASSLPYPDVLPPQEQHEQVVSYLYRFSADGEHIIRDRLPPGFHPSYLANPPSRRNYPPVMPPPPPPLTSRQRLNAMLPQSDPSGSWADCETETLIDSSVSYLSPRHFPSYADFGEYVDAPLRDGDFVLNSQSNSPVFTVTTNSSPEMLNAPPSSAQPMSPASPDGSPIAFLNEDLHLATCEIVETQQTVMRRSALRITSSSGCNSLFGSSSESRPAKTVQWLSDVKRRPEDISSDRKVVKHQYSLDNEAERHKMNSMKPAPRHRSAHETQLLRNDLLLPVEGVLSHSGPSAIHDAGVGASHTADEEGARGALFSQDETSSVLSFTSSVHSLPQHGGAARSAGSLRRREEIEGKVECVEAMAALMGCRDVELWSRKVEAMSSTPANCDVMRANHTLDAVVQVLHGSQPDSGGARNSREVRLRMSNVLSNFVHAHPNDRQCHREAKVLKLLETLRMYSDLLRDLQAAVDDGSAAVERLCSQGCRPVAARIPVTPPQRVASLLPDCVEVVCDDKEMVPIRCFNFANFLSRDVGVAGPDGCVVVPIKIEETMAVLTRCSFDDKHRIPIVLLGGIKALAELVKVERRLHGSNTRTSDFLCTDVRRYAVVALTNLTFENTNVKTFLCSFDGFIPVMVEQLRHPADNLRKATAHLFRNLAWKAEKRSKALLSESNVVSVLMRAAMEAAERTDSNEQQGLKEDSTLKVILSALWNLSAHCSKNKADICGIAGALEFLVEMLGHQSVSVVENAGGILRNVSNFISTCEEEEHYRSLLRQHNCLQLLLDQLTSSSLTIVSNACGTLLNLSSHSAADQETLQRLGAIPMLKHLTQSKHKTIATCSSGALKNLLQSAGDSSASSSVSRGSRSKDGSRNEQRQPSLEARKRKNLMLDINSRLGAEASTREDGSESDEGSREESLGQNSQPRSFASSGADRLIDSRDSLEGIQASEISHDAMNATAIRQPLELSKNRGQVFMKQRIQDPYEAGLAPFGDDVGSCVVQQHQISSPAPMFNNYVSSPLSPDAEAFAERDERIMSPSKLEVMGAAASASYAVEREEEEGPTDYSARFGDNDGDEAPESEEEVERQNQSENDCEENEVQEVEDTVRTYCVEGTPYDTPFVASHAGSMTDLREQALRDMENKDQTSGNNKKAFISPGEGARHAAGTDTPASDAPRAFYTEDTPGVFSRDDSFSSLDSTEGDRPNLVHGEPDVNDLLDVADEEKGETEAMMSKEPSPVPASSDAPNVAEQAANESGKLTANQSASFAKPQGPTPRSVKFNQHETPLMYSRSSSMESLNSCDQQSIRTGYSSCDFSRLNSGRVSPSDLPDSPGAITPARRTQSPKRHADNGRKDRPFRASANATAPPLSTAKDPKKPLGGFPLPPKGGSAAQDVKEEGKAPPAAVLGQLEDAPQSQPLEAVASYEDEGVKVFAEEGGTPANFSSRASSDKSYGLNEGGTPPVDGQSKENNSQRQTSEDVVSAAENSYTNLSSSTCKAQDVNDKGRTSEEEEIYAESIFSIAMEQGMPQPKNVSSRPSSRSDGRRSRGSSGIPVKASSSHNGRHPPQVATGIPQAVPRQLFGNQPHPGISQQSTVKVSKPSPRDLAACREAEEEEDQSDESDIMLECLQKGTESLKKSSVPTLGRRFEGEGAPAPSPATKKSGSLAQKGNNHFKASRSQQQRQPLPKAAAPQAPKRSTSALTSPSTTFAPPTSAFMAFVASESASTQQQQQEISYSGNNGIASGHETPRRFATEDTPHAFSRNDSPLSFDKDFEDDLNDFARVNQPIASDAHRFKPHIPSGPRPEISGRSDSSGSSTGRGSKSKSGVSSRDTSFSAGDRAEGGRNAGGDDDEDDESGDDLLADLLNSGMPKSKSEPLNLRAKAEKKPSTSSGGVVKREKKGDNRRRSHSKSPRNSKIIPGVRIPELKLIPRGAKKEPEEGDGQVTGGEGDAATPVVEEKRWAAPRSEAKPENSMTETLTPANIRRLQQQQQHQPLPRQFDLRGPVPAGLNVEARLTTSTCSNISSIQPPSLMMESLMSMSGDHRKDMAKSETKTESPRLTHRGISGQKMIARRALGTSGPGSSEDLSSMSSCISNIENIQPPTIMNDAIMDASIISVASIKSEVADLPPVPPVPRHHLEKQGSSDSKSSDSPSLERKLNEQSMAMASLDGIQPPTIMDDVTALDVTEKTLVADDKKLRAIGRCDTYTLDKDGEEAGVSTYRDVTDVFDDDTTLAALESDSDAAPDLPRDSRQGTPRHSAGGSREGTPGSRRKNDSSTIEYFRKYRIPTPNIDDSAENSAVQDTSGYRSENTQSSSRRRKENEDRFKTHTITKEDLTPKKESRPFMKGPSFAKLLRQQESGSESSPTSSPKRSPKSVKQRREEEPDRFKTHTITQSDLKPTMQAIPIDLDQDGGDVKAAADGLGSAENSPRRGARISKPGESSSNESSPRGKDATPDKSVRGRRKPLYSTPPKRQGPPVAPKPAIAPKPKYMSSVSSPGRMSSPPTQIRGTRASNLRQTSNRQNSPPSSPRGAVSSQSLNSGYSSAASTCSSRASSSKITRPSSRSTTTSRASAPLVRQGTFTKEDSSSNLSSAEESQSARGGARRSPKSLRKDMVHPAGRPMVAAKPPMSATTSRTRMVQDQRKLSQPKFGQPRPVVARPPSARGQSGTRAPPIGAPLPSTESQRQRRNPSLSSHGSNGSLASVRSAKSSNLPVPRAGGSNIPASKSSHNLRTANDSLPVHDLSLGRRAPSHSSIVHRPRAVLDRTDASNFSGISTNESVDQSKDLSKAKKKEVTSRIANLWKKVEDSKKKKVENDPKVWITQGKVIPDDELAFLRPHEEQQRLIQQQQQANGSTTNDVKPRSKSRLSLKLSKFKQKKDDKTPTSPTAEEPTSISPTSEFKIEDSLNGNVPRGADNETASSELIRRFQTSPSNLHSPPSHADAPPSAASNLGDDSQVKRHSRLGSFFNPETGVATSTPATGASHPAVEQQQPNLSAAFQRPNRSQASAIVPPFNYSPPNRNNDSAASSIKSPMASAQVRRNDSYVSSMGRRPAVVDGKEADQPDSANAAGVSAQRKKNSKADSSSTVVTLV